MRDPYELSSDPWVYQRFIQGCKAEFSVAKHGYVTTASGWFSDRSAEYLASGRPVVTQETGFSRWLQTGAAFSRLRRRRRRAPGIERVSRDYGEHCRAARAVAEEYFDARRVLPSLLDRAAATAAPLDQRGRRPGDGRRRLRRLAFRCEARGRKTQLRRAGRSFARPGGVRSGEPAGTAATSPTRRLVERVCRECGVDVVVHFAAFAYVAESVANPSLYYENNVGKTIALLRAVSRAGVRRFVFSSSCATYGETASGLSISESTPQIPLNPYGRTKLIVEQILNDYGSAYGFRSVSLRYFNAAGASEKHALYEQHDPETHLIPLAIAAAVGSGTLDVFGSDYPTPDGTCIRDYVHVDDLADAHVRAVDRLRAGGASLRANLGIGHGASVLRRRRGGGLRDGTRCAPPLRARTARRSRDPRRERATSRAMSSVGRLVTAHLGDRAHGARRIPPS